MTGKSVDSLGSSVCAHFSHVASQVVFIFRADSGYYQFNNAPYQVFEVSSLYDLVRNDWGVASNHGPGCDDYHLRP